MSSNKETVYLTYSKTPMDKSDDVDRNGAVAMVHERPGGGGDLLSITFYHTPECSPSMNTCRFWDFMPSRSSST